MFVVSSVRGHPAGRRSSSPAWLGAFVLVVAVAIVLAGCSPLVVDGRNIDGTAWRAVSVDGRSPATGEEPTLRFEFGSVHANGGCNGIVGQEPASIAGNRVDLGDLLMTTGACLDGNGHACCDLEDPFLQALGAADRIAFEGEQLVLDGPAGQVVLERIP
jgi:heat shock protein HslJ